MITAGILISAVFYVLGGNLPDGKAASQTVAEAETAEWQGEPAVQEEVFLQKLSKSSESNHAEGFLLDQEGQAMLSELVRTAVREELMALYEAGELDPVMSGAAREAIALEQARSSMVNLNSASKEELMTLPGIGASRAEAILSCRAERGGFQKPEEVMQVPGIKEAAFQKIKDKVYVE